MSEWFEVESIKPYKSRNVLVITGGGSMCVGYRNPATDMWFRWIDGDVMEITHWQNLPEPPKPPQKVELTWDEIEKAVQEHVIEDTHYPDITKLRILKETLGFKE